MQCAICGISVNKAKKYTALSDITVFQFNPSVYEISDSENTSVWKNNISWSTSSYHELSTSSYLIVRNLSFQQFLSVWIDKGTGLFLVLMIEINNGGRRNMPVIHKISRKNRKIIPGLLCQRKDCLRVLLRSVVSFWALFLFFNNPGTKIIITPVIHKTIVMIPIRSEERRVGKECADMGRTRLWRDQ